MSSLSTNSFNYTCEIYIRIFTSFCFLHYYHTKPCHHLASPGLFQWLLVIPTIILLFLLFPSYSLFLTDCVFLIFILSKFHVMSLNSKLSKIFPSLSEWKPKCSLFSWGLVWSIIDALSEVQGSFLAEESLGSLICHSYENVMYCSFLFHPFNIIRLFNYVYMY